MRGLFFSGLVLVSWAVPMAQRPAAAEDVVEILPSDPAAWLNAPPLTADMLKGKGVVLWFFEEQCPNCRNKWPGMYELAKKYEGQPVVFMAVNSGNSRDVVQQYAQEVSLRWPVIVDSSRQMEKLWLTNEISLQNVYQVAVLTPSGERAMGNFNEMDATVQKALAGASWKIDPKTIPAAFQPTWMLVEMGKYSQAAPMLKKGLTTNNAEVKDAANRVFAVLKSEMQPMVDRALAAKKAGDNWVAYKQLASLGATFAGLDLPAEAVTAHKELAADEKVKEQLTAAKQLETIKKAFPNAQTALSRKQIVVRLESLVKRFPQTEAAQESQALLDEAKGN